MSSGASALFRRVPPSLFGPLGDPYAELYWAVLASLYENEFEREPFVVVRGVAIEMAERAVRASSAWRERTADLQALAREDGTGAEGVGFDDEAALMRAAARRLVARLERTGWIHFQYRSGIGEVMSFHPYAARITETLMRIARDEQPALQGYVHSIAALLEAQAFAQRPGVSLFEAKRHTLDLVRELKILERNIHLFTQRILDEAATASRVLEEGFDHYEQAVMTNYHRLKTVDNVYRQRSAILRRLETIERDDGSIERATDWYEGQLNLGPIDARAAVRNDLQTIRAHFDAIPRLVEDIDARNARFSHATLRKLMYLLRQDRRTEGQLEMLVDVLAKGDAPDLEFDVFKCELLFGEFLYTPPKQRTRPEPQAIRPRTLKDEAAVRSEVSAKLNRPFARKRIEAYVEELLAGRAAASLEEVAVTTDEEYVRLLYLAAYGLDRNSSFLLDAGEQRIKKGIYEHPSGRIVRRGARRRGK